MNLLSVVQHVAGRTNLPTPSSVLGSADPQVTQLLRLLEEEGTDLSRRGDWQTLTRETTWITTAAEDQGALTTLTGDIGTFALKRMTIWDRSTRLPILGPLNDHEWQRRKAMNLTGPRYQYRIRGDHFLVNPSPPAGETWAFEVQTNYWILGIDGTTYKQYFTIDTDTVLLPPDLIIMGLRWRYLRAKGLDYAEEMRTYEFNVKDALGRDGTKSTLSMDGEGHREAMPGVIVPTYSWNIP